MSDSQRPKLEPAFEIPDLELGAAPRSVPETARAAQADGAARPDADRGYSAPNLFDEDSLMGGAVSLELDHGEGNGGTMRDLADADAFELQPAPRAPDPAEIALVANYGAVPSAPHLSPLYAYRVFTRQRELKRELARIAAESARAEREREAALAQVPDGQLDRVRSLSERAAKLQRRVALQRSAIDSFDRKRAAQGVRLALTVVGIVLVLLVMKLLF